MRRDGEGLLAGRRQADRSLEMLGPVANFYVPVSPGDDRILFVAEPNANATDRVPSSRRRDRFGSLRRHLARQQGCDGQHREPNHVRVHDVLTPWNAKTLRRKGHDQRGNCGVSAPVLETSRKAVVGAEASSGSRRHLNCRGDGVMRRGAARVRSHDDILSPATRRQRDSPVSLTATPRSRTFLCWTLAPCRTS